MKKFLILFFLMIFSLRPAMADIYAPQDSDSLRIGGHYKNFFVSTQSLSTKEKLFADTQRLRLEFEKSISPLWQVHFSVDNEMIFNDFSETADFDLIRSKSQDRTQHIDLDKASVDNDHLYFRHAVYRAYLKYYDPRYQWTIGKQAIDWGKMRFYSPLDLFNAVGPIELERDQRIGLDAINFNLSPHQFGGLNLVASPGKNSEENHYGLKLYQKFGTYDLALIGGHVAQDEILGFSFDGYLGKAGLRGEVAQIWLDNKRNFPRASLGMDYNFSHKLYVLGEYFYNGGPENNNLSSFSFSYDTARRFLSIEKNLFGLWIQYLWTPLLKSNIYMIYDWDGESLVTNPELRYSPTQNFDLALGVQLFGGESGSEFGDLENIYYAEAKWFF